MRWLGTWAAATVGSAVLFASGCLTSQEDAGGGGRVEDPPVTIGRSGSGGASQGGSAGDDTGGRSGSGGRAGRGGGGNGDGGSDDGCSDDTDCAFRVDERSRCSAPTGECVECLSVADCEANEECVGNDCRPITTCATSDDCPHDLVCNPTTDRCVQCFGATGCATGDVCVGSTCRKPCATDSQCVFFGLRCDATAGYCASCLGNADCPDDRNCQQGTCVRDICVGGSASCDDNSLASCNAAGSQFTYPTPCGSRTTCTEDGSEARCEPWVCEPGTTGCSLAGERVVTCSDDGLEETLVEDCEAVDQLCVGSGMCLDAVCEPSMTFCQGNTVQLCDSTGSSSSPIQTCTTGQLCNPQTVACAIPRCAPNQPACDGNVYTTCNAQGFGYTGTRTDCTMTDQFCGLTGCTSSAVDTIPPMNPTLYTSGALSNYLMVNFFSVNANRNLSRIEQYMSPTAAMTLTWVVFESTTQTGTYTSISSTTTTSTTGTGYQASGALAVPLVAGRYYAIGVSWTTPALLFGYQSGTASQTVSFGALIGATFPTTPAATSISGAGMSTSAFLPQRLTTAP